MNLLYVILISISLSVDNLTLSMDNALKMRIWKWSLVLRVAFVFALFQGVMPLLGGVVGVHFIDFFERWDDWITFAVLSFIGLKMIVNALFSRSSVLLEDNMNWRRILIIALLINVDSLTVGVMFVSYRAYYFPFVLSMTIVGFLMSVAGSVVARYSHCRLKMILSIVGGSLLLFMAFRMLLCHSVSI